MRTINTDKANEQIETLLENEMRHFADFEYYINAFAEQTGKGIEFCTDVEKPEVTAAAREAVRYLKLAAKKFAEAEMLSE
jgi:predicted transcriptional regulator